MTELFCAEKPSLKKSFPVPTEWDKKQVFKCLPSVKKTLIEDLVATGWRESWVRHLIWLMRCRGEIYVHYGVVKKT